MPTADLVMEHPSTKRIEPAITPIGIKTILFHVHNDEGLDNRFQIALSMARAFGAHLHLVHVTPIEAYTLTDAFGVVVSPEILDVLEDQAGELRAKLEQHLSKEDVSWDYEEAAGGIIPFLVKRAALADLVITGRQSHSSEFGRPAIAVVGDLVHRIRTPIFVVGDGVRQINLFGPAIVAWDGSFEVANAVRSALPLLKLASQVRVVSVEEPKDYRFPSTHALEYLSRHGIHAELVQRPQIADNIESEILEQAAICRATYVVMGAYSHTRVGEFLFGGVTRSLLQECPVSLVMAH